MNENTMDPHAKLREQNEKLREENAFLHERVDTLQRSQNAERQYLLGLIEGLKFATRCNGVSGGEIAS